MPEHLAWAHLILYGEEATRKARLEGEEAAAAYEQEKKDIAAGKVVAPPPKPPKKKRKKNEKKSDDEGTDEKAPKPKKKRAPNQNKSSPGSIAETNPLLAKAAISVPILAPREEFETMGDSEMIRAASARMEAARNVRNRTIESQRPQQVPLYSTSLCCHGFCIRLDSSGWCNAHGAITSAFWMEH